MEIKSLRQLSVIALATFLLIPMIFAAVPTSAQPTYNVMNPPASPPTDTYRVTIIAKGSTDKNIWE